MIILGRFCYTMEIFTIYKVKLKKKKWLAYILNIFNKTFIIFIICFNYSIISIFIYSIIQVFCC